MMEKDKLFSAAQVEQELRKMRNPEKAAFYPRFFKAGPGEYGEGDKFIGVVVPDQRKIARRFKDLPIGEIKILLDNAFHECRLTGILILVNQYERAHKAEDKKQKTELYNFYLKNLDRVNNWDLVDSSAHKIVGPYLVDRDRKPLLKLARARHLWKNRVAMIATLHYIKMNDFEWPLRIAETLVNHQHDLIHKAVGWMLREIGNRDEQVMLAFLREHPELPRTSLRYAIEKLPREKRAIILSGKIAGD